MWLMLRSVGCLTGACVRPSTVRDTSGVQASHWLIMGLKPAYLASN